MRTQSRYLIIDVSINIDSDEQYAPIVVWSWVALGFYAVGMIVLNAVLLWLVRKDILNGRTTPLSTAIRFLSKSVTATAY